MSPVAVSDVAEERIREKNLKERIYRIVLNLQIDADLMLVCSLQMCRCRKNTDLIKAKQVGTELKIIIEVERSSGFESSTESCYAWSFGRYGFSGRLLLTELSITSLRRRHA